MKRISLSTALVLLAMVTVAQEGRAPKGMKIKLSIRDSI